MKIIDRENHIYEDTREPEDSTGKRKSYSGFHRIDEYIYYEVTDEGLVPSYSTSQYPDKYENNMFCVKLTFSRKLDREIILDSIFGKEQRRNK